MSKKSKRQTRIDVATQSGQTPAVSTRSSEFNPDYSYVIKDLRRIGILASTFILILVALSFFLR
ncbi:MAG: hypothetical protein EHM41_00750 [Chloroflexi bacterium]|nr:MAG: hypothetical protein EHM41_00750 [Chloroflexota bacterium]